MITSDLHYTTIDKPYCGVSSDARLRCWVDAVLREHAARPFDLIVIAGDVSLDYWGWNGGGSYQRVPAVSETKVFMEQYASRLPQNVPVLVLPGNHELYSNEKWRELTGNDRSCAFVLGTNLFLMPDSYSGAVDPAYEGGGKNDSPYAPLDMDFIQSEIDKHPACRQIYLISHEINMSKESEAFKRLLRRDRRVKGLFAGHTHRSAVQSLDPEYAPLTIARTGSLVAAPAPDGAGFSWGFRDLLINADGTAVSRYIVPEMTFRADGEWHTTPYCVKDTVTYPLTGRVAE